jgi:hypothetical protein
MQTEEENKDQKGGISRRHIFGAALGALLGYGYAALMTCAGST